MRFRDTTSVAAALLCVWALTANLSAQRAVPRGGSSGGSGGGHSSGGSGGGHSSGGSGGGAKSGGSSSGGGQKSGGAVQRAPARDGGTSKGGTVVARTPEPTSGNTRDGSTSTPARSDDEANESAPTTSRGREGTGAYGKAVPRRGAPPRPGGDDIFVSGGYYGGYYPWGWSGIGFGGYYGGYYDPWYYGGYPPVYSGSYNAYDGMLRLKMKPRDAQVLVDGYFMGVVDDFDGTWQRLHIEPGPHRIDVRAEGYETLMFEVNIQPDRTITYTGELRRVAP